MTISIRSDLEFNLRGIRMAVLVSGDFLSVAPTRESFFMLLEPGGTWTIPL